MNNKENISIVDVYELIQEFRKEMKDTYVTKDQFEPVRNIVFGASSLIMVSVLVGLIALVVRN